MAHGAKAKYDRFGRNTALNLDGARPSALAAGKTHKGTAKA